MNVLQFNASLQCIMYYSNTPKCMIGYIKGMCGHVTVVIETHLLFQVGELASLPVPKKTT